MNYPDGPSAGTGARRCPPVVVLGMHRSGTSLTARLLQDMGWYLGEAADLLGPREDNPEGFFERADVQVLNDTVLERLDASWDAPPGPEEFGPLLDSRLEKELDELLSSLRAAAGDRPFAIKDPRLCVVWPLWARHLPADVTLVLTVRDPVEVARSLYARDHMPLHLGLALWENYVRRALLAAANRPVAVVRYGDLVAQPRRSMQQLADALGATAPPSLAEAVRPVLHRSRRDSDGELLTHGQRDLWSWLEALAPSLDELDVSGAPEPMHESSVGLLVERRRQVQLQRESAAVRHALSEARSAVDDMADQHAAWERLLRERNEDLAKEQRLHESTRDGLAALRDEHEELARARRAVTLEFGVLRRDLRHSEAARSRQVEQSRQDLARLGRLRGEVQALDQLVESLRQESDEAKSRLGRELAALEKVRAELADALAEQSELARLGRARGEVMTFQRDQLLRALSVVEAQRRAHEATIVTMRASRAWRWGRRLSSPLGRTPMTREEQP